jgi:hypothetical protein
MDTMTGAVLILRYDTKFLEIEALKATPTHRYSGRVITTYRALGSYSGKTEMLDYAMRDAVDKMIRIEEVRTTKAKENTA